MVNQFEPISLDDLSITYKTLKSLFSRYNLPGNADLAEAARITIIEAGEDFGEAGRKRLEKDAGII